ncbi:MAG: hypothetical protein RLZZ283_783 [Candidatus Parcubacteria bacterium]|jgi:hypothetical protein
MEEKEILSVIESDPWMMSVLRAAATLNLPDWMIGAGFVRSKIWDTLSGTKHEHSADIDLIYFDPNDINPEKEKEYASQLQKLVAVEWEVVNEARAHVFNGLDPFTSSEDAMAHWTETATAVAVTLRGGDLKLIAPYGISDLVGMIVRPCPKFPRGEVLMRERIAAKKWLEKWPQLKVITDV